MPIISNFPSKFSNGNALFATLDEDGLLASEQRPSPEQLGAVPVCRKINGAPLRTDITLIPPNIGAASNPNLLDNWYFADPVNQSGITEYSGASGYFIDRWKRDTGILTKLTAEGLELRRNSKGDNAVFQKVEYFSYFPNLEFTLSILVQGSENTKVRLGYSIGQSGTYGDWIPLTGGLQLITHTFVVSSIGQEFNVIIRAYVSDNSVNEALTLKAAKFELGSQQTLAHQDASGTWVLNDPPPNKALELAKCQRYQVVFREHAAVIGYGIAQTAESVLFEIPTPVTMRSRPAVTYKNIGLFGTGGLTTENALEVMEITSVILTQNGLRAQAKTSGATPGNSYVLVIKNNGELIFNSNL